jgi:hypothetical protein
MPVLTEVVEGWSGALPFRLDADGVPVDLTGLTVHVVLKTSDGTVVRDTTAGLTVTSATGGLVSYAPATSSGSLFTAAGTPYYLRFRVTDALQKVVYFPNADEDVIKVNRV